MNRRAFLIGGGLAGLMLFGAAYAFTAIGGVPTLTAREAAREARTGEILLFDIRSPREWQETGIAGPAHALSMHEPGFIADITRQVAGNKRRKIALICAQGVRSRVMSLRLMSAGFTEVIDVPEGMLGSAAGRGWIAERMPLRAYVGADARAAAVTRPDRPLRAFRMR